MDISVKEVLDKIKTARKIKGLSQEEMGTQLNMDYSTYGKIENGFTKLTVDRLYEIASILQLNVSDLLPGKPSAASSFSNNGKITAKLVVELPFTGEETEGVLKINKEFKDLLGI